MHYTHLTYNAIQGLPWQRLVIVRDKWSHRIIRPTDVWGVVKTGEIGRMELGTVITPEGGVLLYLTEEETKDLPVGDLQFDVIATLPKRAMYDGDSTTVTRPVAEGIISVSALGTVTPIEEIDYMELRLGKGEDFYRTFTWRDSAGAIVTVQNAYMQAKDSSGATIVDLRWYATAPSEATISGLTGNRRGYLAPVTGGSFILHISNLNTAPAGSYAFDVFVQDGAGDWSRLTKGTLVIESSVSVMP